MECNLLDWPKYETVDTQQVWEKETERNLLSYFHL